MESKEKEPRTYKEIDHSSLISSTEYLGKSFRFFSFLDSLKDYFQSHDYSFPIFFSIPYFIAIFQSLVLLCNHLLFTFCLTEQNLNSGEQSLNVYILPSHILLNSKFICNFQSTSKCICWFS